MGILNIMQSGKSGMATSKAGIATSGHNISNANTEGFSRQRVNSEAEVSAQMTGAGGPYIGKGSKISRIERVNDQYLERQMRDSGRELAHFEEKQLFLGQIEDVFNEMNGDGLNRLVARFFNDFRKLSNDPSSEAIRQSVRESSQAMVNDFQRVRKDLEQVRSHIDNRIEGSVKELDSMADELKMLNLKIHNASVQKHEANDLEDSRDRLLGKMATMADLAMHRDEHGMVSVDVRGVGPLVTGPNAEKYFVSRAPAQPADGSLANSLQISRSKFGEQYITHQFQNGKLGALIEMRDKTLSSAIDRLDQLAHAVGSSVNEIHRKGFTADGRTGVDFFKISPSHTGAAQVIGLSDTVKRDASSIAAGLVPQSPGDNRLALAIANLQNAKFLNGGQTTADDFYNSIVSDVGVISARNTEALGAQKGIMTNIKKMREQISGVSIDEEITDLMKYQHSFDASARVIRVADEMLDTILSLKR